MYYDATHLANQTGRSRGVHAAHQSLQAKLFDQVDVVIASGTSLPSRVFFFGDIAVGAGLWDWAACQGAELVLRNSAVLSSQWVVDNAHTFDCMVVDAEFLPDLEDTVDFCMSVRQAVPELPIVLISTQVRDSDLSSARMMACDATVKWPASTRALTEGTRAAMSNHRQFLAARYGIGGPTAA